jgi:uncharacterized membrane protein
MKAVMRAHTVPIRRVLTALLLVVRVVLFPLRVVATASRVVRYKTNTPVQALVHGAGEALPESMAGRFRNAKTWGEAVRNRIAGQNAAYRSLFPNGSSAVGVGKP